MNIEELKLILETVQGVSGDAALVGIIYVLKGYFVGVVWSGTFLWLTAMICRAVVRTSASESVANVAGMTTPLTPREAKRLRELVALGLEAEKKQQ